MKRLNPAREFVICLLVVCGASVGTANLIGPHFKNKPAVFVGICILMYVVPVVLLFILPPRRRLVRYQRWLRGQCTNCGYNLAGNVSGICPECGNPKSREFERLK